MSHAPEHADPERYVELAAFGTGYRDLWWNRDFLALAAARWNTTTAATVLDVGCGTADWGRTVLAAMAPDAALTGVDRVQAFVNRAAANARPADAFVVGQAEALPFDDASFDIVTCQTVLIHVTDAAVVIGEMRRVAKPGGLVLIAEPDNLAGGLALLGGEPAPSDTDTLAITELLLACQRGKAALREGDERVGAKLPGLMAAAGLRNVAAHTNDRCISLLPPYQDAAMQASLRQERAWIDQEVSLLVGSRTEALRLAAAGGLGHARFEHCWAAVARWMDEVSRGVDAGAYHSARGFVMYLAGGSV